MKVEQRDDESRAAQHCPSAEELRTKDTANWKSTGPVEGLDFRRISQPWNARIAALSQPPVSRRPASTSSGGGVYIIRSPPKAYSNYEGPYTSIRNFGF